MDAILEIARHHKLRVVEDAAHAIPTRYRGRVVGTLGDLTCFSFYATKNVTTGEGGMITTEDEALAERVRLMHLHGMSRDAWKRYTESGSWFYEVLAPGFKYNLSDIAAAIGIPQLRRSDEAHARRSQIARAYDDAFRGVKGLHTPKVAHAADHAWHLYVLQVEPAALRLDRDGFIRELSARKIGTSVHFIPLHLHPYYRDKYGFQPSDYPNAHAAYGRILSLPIYARMSDSDVADVIEAVLDAAERHQR